MENYSSVDLSCIIKELLIMAPVREMREYLNFNPGEISRSLKVDKFIAGLIADLLRDPQSISIPEEMQPHLYFRLRFALDWIAATETTYPEWSVSPQELQDVLKDIFVTNWRIYATAWLLLRLDAPAFLPLKEDFHRALYIAGRVSQKTPAPPSEIG